MPQEAEHIVRELVYRAGVLVGMSRILLHTGEVHTEAWDTIRAATNDVECALQPFLEQPTEE